MSVHLSPLDQALDPGTPAETLRFLAKREECRAAVAANPNTPVEVLLRLAMAFPREVAGNVGFMLAVMTEPERLDELEASTHTLAALCRVPGVPEAVLELGMRSSEISVLRSLLVNPNLPASYVERLVRSKEKHVAEVAPFHRNSASPPGFDVGSVRLEILHAEAPSGEAIEFISGGGIHDGGLLEELSRHQAFEVRAAVARSPRAWPELLGRLSRDAIEAVRRAVARHPGASRETLAFLARDPALQQEVAGNPSTDAGTLAYLAGASREVVRELVAQHASTPVDVLCALALDSDVGVRAAVAGNSNTPPALLSELARGVEGRVLEMLASNPGAPEDALWAVADRGGDDALYAVLARAVLPLDLLMCITTRILDRPTPPLWLLQGLAEHPCTPPEALRMLAALDQDTGIGEKLALNPATPDEVLEALAVNGTYATRLALATRSTLPRSALDALQEDPHPTVRDLAEQVAPAEAGRNLNPYLGTDIARFGITSADDLRRPGESAEADWEFRALKRLIFPVPATPLDAYLAVTHPRFPELEAWSRVELDIAWYVRFAAALSPAAPREVLEQLVNDADRRVSVAAAAGLAT